MNNQLPLVSVCMVSYNQDTYVREALDSVLMQKTDFPVEVIISDDNSSDNTPYILQEYAEKYPNKLYPILGDINLKYPNNLRRALEKARGKYIALCDSDDYWTDSYKLQKQVEFLETHPDCAICFHNVMNIYDGVQGMRTLLNPLDFPTELTIEDLIMRKWFLPTNSEVFRHEYLMFPSWYDSVLHVDYVINAIVVQHGKIHYMPDVMAVYRHTAQSVSVEHSNGKWGYMLFHCRTMKSILTKLKDVYASQYQGLLDIRISEYDAEIQRYEHEIYCDNHLLARVFRSKTYKRFLKRLFLNRLKGRR